MFNLQTGEDDDHPLGGDIGEQSAAPFNPMPAAAPGPEVIPPTPAPMPPPQVAPAPAPGPAGIPPIPQYTPQALPPIPPSRTVTPAESQNLHALDVNAAAREKTADQQGDVSAVGAVAKDQAAERQSFIADAYRQEQQRIAAESQKRIQEREAQAAKDYDAFKAFGIKDPQASDNFATRVLKAITIGLGQYSAGMNGGPNTALNIIQDAAKENIARQKAQQEKLFQVAQKSGKDIEQAKQERDDAFGQLNLKHAALLDSSSAMLRSELARLGMPQVQIDANKDVQTLEKESLGLRQKELADIRDSETSLARADIAAAGRRAKHAAGGGAGSGDALAKFAEAAGRLKPGDPIPPDLVVLGAKAHLKPNQIATEALRYQGAGTKTAGADEKADEAAVKTYVAPYVRSSDELKRRLEALKSAEAGALNPKSSLGEIVSALEQGIAADAGAGVRGVSMGQLHSIIPNLVSAEGKVANIVSQNWDGTAGEEFRKATLRFIQRAQKERRDQMREKGEGVERDLAATPRGKADPDFARRGRERLFPTEGAAAGGGGATPKKLKASDVEAIQWAKRNPRDAMAKDIFRRNGLDENGNKL